MSLTSYADLQAQAANWLARDDLNTYIPDMITLFEAAACRRLKVRPMEATASISTTAGVGTLPADYLGYRSVSWVGQPLTDLNYVAPSIFNYDTPYSVAGVPCEFTIKGSSIYINPQDDSGLSMAYFQRTQAVSGSLNWLWTNHPDAYLFGTLAEANFFNKGSALPLAATWKQRRDEVFSEIFGLDFNERQGMAIRVRSATP